MGPQRQRTMICLLAAIVATAVADALTPPATGNLQPPPAGGDGVESYEKPLDKAARLASEAANDFANTKNEAKVLKKKMQEAKMQLTESIQQEKLASNTVKKQTAMIAETNNEVLKQAAGNTGDVPTDLAKSEASSKAPVAPSSLRKTADTATATASVVTTEGPGATSAPKEETATSGSSTTLSTDPKVAECKTRSAKSERGKCLGLLRCGKIVERERMKCRTDVEIKYQEAKCAESGPVTDQATCLGKLKCHNLAGTKKDDCEADVLHSAKRNHCNAKNHVASERGKCLGNLDCDRLEDAEKRAQCVKRVNEEYARAKKREEEEKKSPKKESPKAPAPKNGKKAAPEDAADKKPAAPTKAEDKATPKNKTEVKAAPNNSTADKQAPPKMAADEAASENATVQTSNSTASTAGGEKSSSAPGAVGGLNVQAKIAGQVSKAAAAEDAAVKKADRQAVKLLNLENKIKQQNDNAEQEGREAAIQEIQKENTDEVKAKQAARIKIVQQQEKAREHRQKREHLAELDVKKEAEQNEQDAKHNQRIRDVLRVEQAKLEALKNKVVGIKEVNDQASPEIVHKRWKAKVEKEQATSALAKLADAQRDLQYGRLQLKLDRQTLQSGTVTYKKNKANLRKRENALVKKADAIERMKIAAFEQIQTKKNSVLQAKSDVKRDRVKVQMMITAQEQQLEDLVNFKANEAIEKQLQANASKADSQEVKKKIQEEYKRKRAVIQAARRFDEFMLREHAKEVRTMEEKERHEMAVKASAKSGLPFSHHLLDILKQAEREARKSMGRGNSTVNKTGNQTAVNSTSIQHPSPQKADIAGKKGAVREEYQETALGEDAAEVMDSMLAKINGALGLKANDVDQRGLGEDSTDVSSRVVNGLLLKIENAMGEGIDVTRIADGGNGLPSLGS